MATGTRRGLLVALCVVGAVGVLAGALHLLALRREREWELDKVELLAATSVADPLIEALEAYRTDHGRFPNALAELVPTYLRSLPVPRFPFDTRWQYRASVRADDYDLYVGVPSDYCPVADVMNFGDYFVYRHSGKYERLEYGGVLERIGRWAYYHE